MHFWTILTGTLRFVWQSTSALIAMILIIAAFVVGTMVGPSFFPSGGNEKPSSTETVKHTDGGHPQEVEEHGSQGEDAIAFWTCSMHPFIHRDGPGQCPICSMDLIPMTEGGGGDSEERRLVMSPDSVKLAEIQTTKVMRMYPKGEVRMVGRIDHDETRLATIAAYFPGRIERMFVDYTGIAVAKGDHLAEIYSPELLEAQEELKQALETVRKDQTASNLVRSIDRAKLQASRDKLRLWGLTDEQIKGIEENDEILERLTIYSPIRGVVIERKAVEGQYVKTGDPIYRISDLSQLWVQLEAYESQLSWIHYGQKVEFTSDSFPGETFYGRISFINPVLDDRTRTVRVRVEAANKEGRLKPGMFVRAVARGTMNEAGIIFDAELAGQWISPMHPEIVQDGPGECPICGMPLVPVEEVGFIRPTDDTEPPLVIPVTAALLTGKRAVVYLRVPDEANPTFEGRVVELGPRAGDFYIVRKGLKVGDEIVRKGNFKIDSSLQIAAKPSMMSPKGGGGGGGMAGMKGMGGGAEESAKEAGSMKKQTMFPAAFLGSLDPVYASYFEMQQALVEDDLESFRKSYRLMWDSVIAVDASSLAGDFTDQWHTAQMALAGPSGAPESVADIDGGRRVFEKVSQALIDVDKEIGHVGDHLHYVDFCPMAFGGQGAEWLSSKPEIENPYLGQQMPGCGEIRKEISPRATEGGSEHGSMTHFDISKVPERFVRSLGPIYERYFEIQRSLVNDDFSSFKSQSQEMYSSIDGTSTDGLTPAMIRQWDEIKATLVGDREHIEHLEGIGVARKLFEKYSQAVIDLGRQFGHPDATFLYVDFCPMAFDGKGALWLSSEEAISNPYLGQDMPGCGEIRETLSPSSSGLSTSETKKGGDR